MNQLLEELKEYLRIDWTEEEEVKSAKGFLNSAILYLENAGVKQPTDYYKVIDEREVYALHRLAIFTLTTHFYENRIAVTPSAIKIAQIPIPYGLQSMILQLKWVDVE